jgi:hypothetical protein
MENYNENKLTHESEEKKNVGALKAEVDRENSYTSPDNLELGSDVKKLFKGRRIGTNDGPVPYNQNFTPRVAREILEIESDEEYYPQNNSISYRRKKSPVIIEEDFAPSETCCPAFFANFRDMFTSLGFCGNKPL